MTSGQTNGLSLRSVVKRFDASAVVDGISLEIEAGEFVALLGPSGCGKTTLLRLVAGFETLSEGVIEAGGAIFAGPGRHLPPEKRNVAIVFQSYALWPHMSVAENIGYPLKVKGEGRAERETAVREALSIVGLRALEDRRPSELSGGQRQRVALARCLVMKPRIVLLDEPLANLDVALRATMEETFREFHERTGATMLYVTHDQAEAMALADRVAVMDRGRIRQLDRPTTLYDQPASEAVARFVGDGRVVDAAILSGEGAGRYRVAVLGSTAVVRGRAGRGPGPARLVLRARDLVPADDGGVEGTVRRSIFRGGHFVVSVDVPLPAKAANAEDAGEALEVVSPRGLARGERVTLAIADGWLVD